LSRLLLLLLVSKLRISYEARTSCSYMFSVWHAGVSFNIPRVAHPFVHYCVAVGCNCRE
jgi:hypothetical protein